MAKARLRVCRSAICQRRVSGTSSVLAVPPCPILCLWRYARPARACCTLVFARDPGSLSSLKRISRTSEILGPRNSSTRHPCLPFGPSILKWFDSCITCRAPFSPELSPARVRRTLSSRLFPWTSATETFNATYAWFLAGRKHVDPTVGEEATLYLSQPTLWNNLPSPAYAKLCTSRY
jgi:hypothetical protein